MLPDWPTKALRVGISSLIMMEEAQGSMTVSEKERELYYSGG